MTGEWIGAAEAAERLGIKQSSLYSYVSRGVLTRRKTAGSRESLFSADEVEGLARRGRPRRAPRAGELVIETRLTEISGDQLRYRGYDAIALAAQRSFEDVAGLLWSGTLGEAGAEGDWQATEPAVAIGSAAQAALPAGSLPLERLQVIVAALAVADPLRLHLDPPAVMAAGRSLIAGLVECLPSAVPQLQPAPPPESARPPEPPPPADPPPADPSPPPTSDRLCEVVAVGSDHNSTQSVAKGVGARSIRAGLAAGAIARRLVPKLCPADPGPELTEAIGAALVLLADHELAASTLAARVAASVRADPYAVVASGLGAVGGSLHGGASFGAEMLLRSAAGPGDAARVVGDLLRRGERIPGFGHFVYRGTDPRAAALMTLLRKAVPAAGTQPADPGSPSVRLAVADAVIAECGRRALPEPNIDFALATLAGVAGMIPGAGEAIFAIARTAGWLAHALEEYARNVPIRPRGVYTGPPASADAASYAG